MNYWKLFGGIAIVSFAVFTSWPDLAKWWGGLNAGSIRVEYPGFNVSLGMIQTPEQVQYSPQIFISVKEDIPSLYTLLMIDPDSPSRHDPWSADWLHWMVVNMQPMNVSSGEVVMPYSGPDPAAGTDQHNIAFIALRQKGIVQVPTPRTRARFDSKDFLKAHKFTGMVAGTFFNMMGPEILETAQAAKPASEPTGQQEAVALEEATQSEASHGLSVDSKTEL